MREKGSDLSLRVDGEETIKPKLVTQNLSLPELLSHPGTSSGSYLQSIISLVSSSPENVHRVLKLNTRTIRNTDYEEYVLEDATTGEVVFKGAKCYGFRNLQNVVRKVGKENGVHGLPKGAVRERAKRRLAEGLTESQDKAYDFVEVMACPSGCVNGGGQIGPPRNVLGQLLDAEGYAKQLGDEGVQPEVEVPGLSADPSAKWGNKGWIRKVESTYWSLADPSNHPTSINADHVAARILKEMCNPNQATDLQLDKNERMWMRSMDSNAEARRREIFRTKYRKVESEVVGLAVKW
jgi:hypothetical protein